MQQYVAAIDQGTTSTRCMVFDHDGRVVSADQREHRQQYPRAGWVEHDPLEIWANTREVAAGALAKAELSAGDIAAVGIANNVNYGDAAILSSVARLDELGIPHTGAGINLEAARAPVVAQRGVLAHQS